MGIGGAGRIGDESLDWCVWKRCILEEAEVTHAPWANGEESVRALSWRVSGAHAYSR